MKIFACQNCGQLVHFENTGCMNCGAPLGFLPATLTLSALAPADGGGQLALGGTGEVWLPCANAEILGCNWMVPADDPDGYCPSCALNSTIPDLDVPGNVEGWRDIEVAKRRLVYALLRLNLPLTSAVNAEGNLRFDFLADIPGADPVLTGHDEGLITLNMAEADSAERERRRAELGEPYRTLLGHLRHEVGHYYWDLLVRDGGRIEDSRAVFGDESIDYGEALQKHYENGAPPDWQLNYVSAYATMHPWEDFAETWTHYLHMIDSLDTAASFGMAINPVVVDDPAANAYVGFDPYHAPDVDRLVDAWRPLTVALNSMNRSMGSRPLSLCADPARGGKAALHPLAGARHLTQGGRRRCYQRRRVNQMSAARAASTRARGSAISVAPTGSQR